MDIPLTLLLSILRWIDISDPDKAAMAMLPLSEEFLRKLRELAWVIEDDDVREFVLNELQ